MASTVTYQSVADYARTLSHLIPIVGVGGFTNEPALSICNDVLQEILSAPYAWRFNRKTIATFQTINLQQDYSLVGPTDIGWIEACVLEDFNSTSTIKPRHNIEVVAALPLESIVQPPFKVAMQSLDSADNPTFRFWPVPSSQIWTANLVYQAKSPIGTSMASTWSPIPDELGYVYRQGFLAKALRLLDDPRAEAEYQRFMLYLNKALDIKDQEIRHESFFPDRPALFGG